ncbi:MPEG1-like protein [Mya arenaria]|uniref:MPEG1-like protein n=1 Tax=Mya arenaria TaxID=6604 RepID=A0ABY7DRL5_MYAAR|nr:MPEG1-like protein [Mya arenaria]
MDKQNILYCALVLILHLKSGLANSNRCLDNDAQLRFEALPGRGWDNLVNKEQDQVFDLSYIDCRISEDRKYTLPDGVTLIPRKSAQVYTHAEVFEHWDNYTSITAKSMNVEGGLNFDVPLEYGFGVSVDISGKYSSDYQSVKSHQNEENAITTRVQLRYLQYTAKLEPDVRFTEAFAKRLNQIAAFIEFGDFVNARYESQLLVRDFGTHVITSIDAGAALVKSSSEDKRVSVRASAGLSFLGLFKIGPSIHFGIDTDNYQSSVSSSGYLSKVTSSEISTIGGPVYRPDMSVANWTESLDNNIVALDRSGQPLSNFITEYSLPLVSYKTVRQLQRFVTRAIQIYYNRNTYRGCTQRDSPNFNYFANFDDGSCKPPTTQFQFGGVYQTCTGDGHLCTGKETKNMKTGDFTCPVNYKTSLIDSFGLSRSDTQEDCHRCWVFFKCCKYYDVGYVATVKTYWCASDSITEQDKGYLFGGFYSDAISNVQTKQRICPTTYIPTKILDDVTICLSDDYELGFEFSLPFAGFFSCKSNNPLTKTNTPTCPTGFSQHILDVNDDCEIYYCIQTGAMSVQGLPPVRKLPFQRKPRHRANKENHKGDKNVTYVISEDGSTWTTLDKANETMPKLLKEHGFDIIMTRMSPSVQNVSEIAEMSMMVPASAIPVVICQPSETTTKVTKTEATARLAYSDQQVSTEGEIQRGSSNEDSSVASDGSQVNVAFVVVCSVLGTLSCVVIVAAIVLKIRRKSTSYTQI